MPTKCTCSEFLLNKKEKKNISKNIACLNIRKIKMNKQILSIFKKSGNLNEIRIHLSG